MQIHRLMTLFCIIFTLEAMEHPEKSRFTREDYALALNLSALIDQCLYDRCGGEFKKVRSLRLRDIDVAALFIRSQEMKQRSTFDARQLFRWGILSLQSTDPTIKIIAVQDLAQKSPKPKFKADYVDGLATYIAKLINMQFDDNTARLEEVENEFKLDLSALKRKLTFPLLQFLDKKSTVRVIHCLGTGIANYTIAQMKDSKSADQVRTFELMILAGELMKLDVENQDFLKIVAFKLLLFCQPISKPKFNQVHLELLCQSAFHASCYCSKEYRKIAQAHINSLIPNFDRRIKKIKRKVSRLKQISNDCQESEIKAEVLLKDIHRYRQELVDMKAYLNGSYDETTTPLLLLTHLQYTTSIFFPDNSAEVIKSLYDQVMKQADDIQAKEKLIKAFEQRLTQRSESATTLESSISAIEKLLPIKDKLEELIGEKRALTQETQKTQLVLFGLMCLNDGKSQLKLLTTLRNMMQESAHCHEGLYAAFEFVRYARKHPELNLNYENELKLLQQCSMPFYNTFARGIE